MEKIRGKSLGEWKEYSKKDTDIPMRTLKYIAILEEKIETKEPEINGTEIREKVTVGKEFIEWAEEYWHLDKIIKIDDPDNFAGEICDYNYIKEIFIKKIDGIIKSRLGR